MVNGGGGIAGPFQQRLIIVGQTQPGGMFGGNQRCNRFVSTNGTCYFNSSNKGFAVGSCGKIIRVNGWMVIGVG